MHINIHLFCCKKHCSRFQYWSSYDEGAGKFEQNVLKLYPYLGTIVANNGNFKVNIQELCKSAGRVLKLFDRMILPICTYNCEVWEALFSQESLYLVIF